MTFEELKNRVLESFRNSGKSSVSLSELTRLCGGHTGRGGDAAKRYVAAAVSALIDEGALTTDGERRIFLAEKKKSIGGVRAKIVKLSGSFGFAHPLDDEGELLPDESDYFIPGKFLRGALRGDTVLLNEIPSRGELREGEVLRILEAGEGQFAGVVVSEYGRLMIYSDQLGKFPVPIARGESMGAEAGDKVGAVILRRGERHADHLAGVVKIYGSADDAKSSAEAILDQNHVEREFSEAVLTEAKNIEARGILPEDKEGRLDLRDQIIFTIDSAHTKDIDDAISLEKTDEGYLLGVHIADVSHYVRPGSALNETAFERGTSIYYADSVIPMLPKELSNGICSLNEGEDRLAFSCLMRLTENGGMKGYEFRKSVIRSRIKGVYSEINALYAAAEGERCENIEEIEAKYSGVKDTLFLMKELAEILIRRRDERGAISLDKAESEIVISEDGHPVDIVPRERGIAECMIEEFMLCANQAAALTAGRRGIPFVYRIHEDPAKERTDALFDLVERFGLRLPPLGKEGKVEPWHLSYILKESKGHRAEMLLSTSVLRAMAKAKYSAENKGHFGLVLRNYAHFTSPIRRYPDLAIHRILTDAVGGLSRNKMNAKYTAFASEAAAKSTEREQVALTVERSCDDCYKAEYIRQFLGEHFEGIISSCQPQGIYVELPNSVEGLIRRDGLPSGEYILDEGVSFSNPANGHSFSVGDKIEIIVAAADVASGRIDFVLPGAENSISRGETHPPHYGGAHHGGSHHGGKRQAKASAKQPHEENNRRKPHEEHHSHAERPDSKNRGGKKGGRKFFRKKSPGKKPQKHHS